jgi:prevent-host-death family protein
MKIPVAEAQRRFFELVDRAAGGDEIIIADKDEPIARLVAIPPTAEKPGQRRLGSARGEFIIPDDFNTLS